MHRSFIDRLLLPAIFGLATMIAGLVLWQSLVTGKRKYPPRPANRLPF